MDLKQQGILTLLFSALTHALDNGLARVPPMGYNTWYDVTGDFDEALLRATVDAHVRLGLPDFGYNYWNLDDLWSGGRYPNGSIFADPAKFPSKSLRPLADYVHSQPGGTCPHCGSTLLFGAYSDRGTKQCGPGPGSFNHTTKDANSFAAWTVDYLKEDSCAASQDHATAYAEYGRMRDALNRTGRPIVFSLCGWEPWYSNPDPSLGYGGGKTLGNLWRIGPDDTNWHGVLANININSQLAANAGPGGFNDPCLLLAEDNRGRLRITQLQTRAQFSMWAVMASPLIISANIRNMSQVNLETYTNREVIAVDQDPLGVQGTRVMGHNLRPSTPGFPSITGMQCTIGALTAGGDIHVANMSLQQAAEWCHARDACAGFTSKSSAPGSCNSSQVMEFYFKDATAGSNTDPEWSTWLKGDGATNVWARPLTSGSWAFVFLNAGAEVVDVVCDNECVSKTALVGRDVTVRDLWLHKDIAVVRNLTSLKAPMLPADGGHAMYLLTPHVR